MVSLAFRKNSLFVSMLGAGFESQVLGVIVTCLNHYTRCSSPRLNINIEKVKSSTKKHVEISQFVPPIRYCRSVWVQSIGSKNHVAARRAANESSWPPWYYSGVEVNQVNHFSDGLSRQQDHQLFERLICLVSWFVGAATVGHPSAWLAVG